VFTQLVRHKNNQYCCGNCRMIQRVLAPVCWFCEYEFTNYGSTLIENYKDRTYAGNIFEQEEVTDNDKD